MKNSESHLDFLNWYNCYNSLIIFSKKKHKAHYRPFLISKLFFIIKKTHFKQIFKVT